MKTPLNIQKIKDCLLSLGLSKKDFCENHNIAYSSFLRLINKGECSTKMLFKVARGLNLSIQDLLG